MININEVIETNKMIDKENLDVRTITMGISLLDCIDSDLDKVCENVYNKITTMAKDLVATGEEISTEFGIPIVNKRISVTPIALVGGSACKTPDDFVKIAQALDRAAKKVGVNFIGGYTALVSKKMTDIGGTSAEMCLSTVKKASAGYLDELPTSGNEGGRCFRDLEWEEKVLKICRESGVGAQFGGKYLVHDVRVIRAPRHAASCPVSAAAVISG